MNDAPDKVPVQPTMIVIKWEFIAFVFRFVSVVERNQPLYTQAGHPVCSSAYYTIELSSNHTLKLQ